MQDYYYILGLSPEATGEEIKQAYRKLATKFHPDKNAGDQYFAEMFKQIQEAYEILGDDDRRAAYDDKCMKSSGSHQTMPGTPQRRRKKHEIPKVVSFSSNRNTVHSGQEITLSWHTQFATKIEILTIGEVSYSGKMKFVVPELKGEDLQLELRAHLPEFNEYDRVILYLRNGDEQYAKDRARLEKVASINEARLKGIHPQVLKTGRAPALASLGSRGLAMLIDFVIVSLLALILVKVLPFALPDDPGRFMPLIWLLYGAWFESGKNKGTPGKYLLYLEVVNLNGEKLSFLAALWRNFVKLFSSALLGLGLLMAFFDKRYRTLHDRAAGTLVTEWGWGKAQVKNVEVQKETS